MKWFFVTGILLVSTCVKAALSNFGMCTCTPGSSPPVCVSSHQTWDNYCDNLVECMKTKNVFLFHFGSCLIKNRSNVPPGGCTCAPGSSPAVCTSKGTWNNYCNHLNYCLELKEAFKIHDGPCLIKDIEKAGKNLGACTCRPGSSPAVCTNQGTWDNYCNNLNYCLELKRAYKLYDGPCRNSNTKLALSGKSRLPLNFGMCTCTPGSSPPVCVSSHQTWDNYCDNLVECMKTKNVFLFHFGSCLIKNRSNVPPGGCTCAPGSSPAVCTSKGTWNNYCNHLNYCLELKEAFKIHDGPCLIKDIEKAGQNLGACTCRPGSSPAVCTNQGTWDNYCNNLNYCLELKRAYKLYDGPCRNYNKELSLSNYKAFIKDMGGCTCTPGSSPPVCVSNHETWDNYCNNLDDCLKFKALFKLHDGPCNSADWFKNHKNWGLIHGRPKYLLPP